MIPPVLKEITVPASPADAFRIYWSEIGHWWPLHTHSLSGMAGQKARGIEFEPKLGGAITEIMEDGTRQHWGTVTEWVPGQAMAHTWQLGRPESEATQVRITFAANEAGTRVTLTHGGWEKHGADGAKTRDNYDQGWNAVFRECYAAACGRAAAE
ncbi:MAG: SRPBCC domain-containing protein [Paracoccaceae bacterium]